MVENLHDEKIKECTKIFNLFDTNKDGKIDTKELGDVMRALGVQPKQTELLEIVKKVDTNASGNIDLNEFLSLFERKVEDNDTEGDLIEAFKSIDNDGDGLISAKELRHIMATLGEQVTEEEADEMIKEADYDGDGFINYHDFYRIIMTK